MYSSAKLNMNNEFSMGGGVRGMGERSGLEPAEEYESSEKIDEEEDVAGKVCLRVVRGIARGATERAANS